MFLVFSISAMAATINVPGDQPAIQEGIDAAADYDTVLVAPGTYEGLINFSGKLIVLKSAAGPLVTTITGDDEMYSALVTFNHGENQAAVLEGFTLLEGWLAVYCEGAGPTIRYNILKDQHTTEWAAINLAGPGYPPSAGIGPAPARIINNTIVNCINGGISSFSNIAPIIKNNIIAYNGGYGIHLQSDMLPAKLSYNDVYGNADDYINSHPGKGSISTDPLFNPNFTLDPDSPCIDNGDPDPLYNDSDLTRNDMGAIPYILYPIALNVNFGVGVDNESINNMTPDIFWSYHDIEETMQQGYEIEVGTDNDWPAAEMWATGPVSSGDTSAVYGGAPLEERTTYYLRVRVSNGTDWGRWIKTHFRVYEDNIVINVPGLFATIQEAVDYSVNGDTVLVAPGTYEGLINFNGRLTVLMSSGGPLETIITGPDDMYSALVTFKSGETEESVLEGFTLLEGWLGVYCEGAGPTIRRNIFKDQHTTEWAAINLAAPGYPPSAGIGPAPATIINNTIVNCANGGISSFSTETPIVRNNIIAFNGGYGIHLQGEMLPAELSYNNFYGNEIDYINIVPGAGSISADPMFNEDFTLAMESPCIDAGDPDPIYNDSDGSRNDMGAISTFLDYPIAVNINFGVGVDNESINNMTPEIFWSYHDSEETMQQGYEIEVGTDDDWSAAEMWATGPVGSGDTSAVYGGVPLEERVTYYARVRLSDGTDWGMWNQTHFRVYKDNITIGVPGLFATIQEAVNYSVNGDTVLVAPGTYEGLINFNGRLTVLMSSGGPLETIIIGPSDMYSALVTFANGETEEAVLEGFTLLEGWLGVYCEGAGPTIKYNIFKDQHTTEWAAINLAAPGYPPSAGIGPAPARIINNTIVNCANGGISSFSTEAPIIKNNIIAFNGGYGIHLQDEMLPADLSYNNFYGNEIDYINIVPGAGSISADPLFTENYSLVAGSPCIDAGDPDPMYNDPDDSRNDMGALWIGGYAAGDANDDDTINLMDVVYLVNYLYKDGPDPVPVPQSGDANGDSALNILDATTLVNFLYRDGPPPTHP